MSQAAAEAVQETFALGLAYTDQVDVPTPAAGATASYAVDGKNSIRVLAATATITTDANVASRLVTLDYINGRGVTYMRNGASVLLTASTTAQAFYWSNKWSVSEWNTGTPVWIPLSDLILPPGFTVKFNVTSIQATDALSGLTLWVEKLPTGATGYPPGISVDRLVPRG